jgi:hypothetical protein
VANQGYTAHGTTEWRNLRAAKLGNQFKNGDCIQEHDQNEALVGSTTRGPLLAPGAFDGRVQPQSPTGTSGERAGATEATARQNRTGLRDIRSFLGVSKRKAVDDRQEAAEKADKKAKYTEKHSHIGVHKKLQPESDSGVGRSGLSLGLKAKPDIFAGVKIFINGSTLLQISDHKLKQDLTNNGAHCAIHMDGTVTHILVGRPNAAGSGAGGGLAARKLQELIARGGKGVKVVSVDWYVLLFFSV